MRALVVEELLPDYAGCVVKEIPTPEPGPGEVRIKVRAAAVNFPDLMQTRGEHQHKPAVPFVGGLELAGEVDAVGKDVTAFQPGDPAALPSTPSCRPPPFAGSPRTSASARRRATLSPT
jgi:NADPH2:quinone reductase